jgi:hypothetical protein
MHGTDAAIGHGVDAVSNVVVDVAGREHRLLAASVITFIEPPQNPSLAIGQFLPYARFHSKSLLSFGCEDLVTLQTLEKREGFEFFQKITQLSFPGSLV